MLDKVAKKRAVPAVGGTNDLANLRVFSLGSNDPLAASIADHLGIALGRCTVKKFADCERYVRLGENVRRKHVVFIQSTAPALDGSDAHWTTLEFAIDAARRASAAEITVVMPYMGYARQERINEPREPIAAKVKLRILETLGASRIVAMDLHAAAIQGFVEIPVDHIYGRPEFLEELEQRFPHAIADGELAFVSPDVGGAQRTRSYTVHSIGNPNLAIMYKNRSGHNQIDEVRLLGEVAGKTCILIDDIIDTGGTMIRAAETLRTAGAKAVYLAAVHGLFSGEACNKLDKADVIQGIFVSNTITERPRPKKAIEISMSRIFAEAIRRGETGESVSAIAQK